jgi:hypothetical protein
MQKFCCKFLRVLGITLRITWFLDFVLILYLKKQVVFETASVPILKLQREEKHLLE